MVRGSHFYIRRTGPRDCKNAFVIYITQAKKPPSGGFLLPPRFPECNHSGGHFVAEWFYLVLPLFIFVFYIRRLMNIFGENE